MRNSLLSMLALLVIALPVTAQSPDSLTLVEALARARAERPQVLLAAAGVERARGASRVATTIPDPVAQFEHDRLDPSHKLTVAQPLGWLPRRAADKAAGRAIIRGAAADSMRVMAELAQDVRVAFYTALAAGERQRLAVAQSAIADSLVVLADRRERAGSISLLEREQVAQEASRTRLVSDRARENARVARVELARAVAWPDGIALPAPVGDLDDGLTPADDTTHLDLAQVPALRVALADSTAMAARLRAARVAQVPMPAIIAGREWGGDFKADPNILIGFSLALPLWNRGRAAVAEARGGAAQSAALAAEARLTLRAQLNAAIIRVFEAGRRARFTRDSLAVEARRIRDGALRLFDAGRTGVVPVFDAVRAERDVADALVQELLAWQVARARLDALVGRWE